MQRGSDRERFGFRVPSRGHGRWSKDRDQEKSTSLFRSLGHVAYCKAGSDPNVAF